MPGRSRDVRTTRVALATGLRRHWLAAILLGAGLLLRAAAQLGYRPALFYIDTIRYLFDSQGNDPVGYRLPLKIILAAANFDAVAAAQHLLGLAMAVAIYLVLVRRGAVRWLAALAIAPVLLDAYQIQMEQMVLPDVWFEALIVAGIAVLLARPAPPGLRAVIAGGILLGVSATFRQVGEILLLPALAYLLIACPGWRTALGRSAALAGAFALPVLAYMAGSYALTGSFYLAHTGVTSTYGRMAWSADCATLRLPAVQRGLCPTPAQRAHGPDWLEHDPRSPIKRYYAAGNPLAGQASHLVASFNNAVLAQQPGRVIASYLRDTVKVFALSKMTSPGDPPISRWQFQVRYPYLSPHATPGVVLPIVARYGGGRPQVWPAAAGFLRRYQLGGGYTPGPLLACCVLAGLAGSAGAVAGRIRGSGPGDAGTGRGGADGRGTGLGAAARRELTLCCLLFFSCGAAVLLISDVFEFSWRYQLPALVTLPPAAAAAVAAAAGRRGTRVAGGPGTLAQTGEQVGLRD
jgi:hypothetical protein